MTDDAIPVPPAPPADLPATHRDIPVIASPRALPDQRHFEIVSFAVPKNFLPEVTRFVQSGFPRQPAVRYRDDQDQCDHYAAVVTFEPGVREVRGALMAEPPEAPIPPFLWSPAIPGDDPWVAIASAIQAWFAASTLTVVEDIDTDLVNRKRFRITDGTTHWSIDAWALWGYPGVMLSIEGVWHDWDAGQVRGEIERPTDTALPAGVTYTPVGLDPVAIQVGHAQGCRWRGSLVWNPPEPSLEPLEHEPQAEDEVTTQLRAVLAAHWNHGLATCWGTPDAPWLARGSAPPDVVGVLTMPEPARTVYERRTWEGGLYSAQSGSQDRFGGFSLDAITRKSIESLDLLREAAEGLGILRPSNPREGNGDLVRFANHPNMRTNREIVYHGDFLGLPGAAPGSSTSSGRNACDAQHQSRSAARSYAALCGLDLHAVDWIESQVELNAANGQLLNGWMQNGRWHGRSGMDLIESALTVRTADCRKLADATALASADLVIQKWHGKDTMTANPGNRCLIVALHSGSYFAAYEEAKCAAMFYALSHRRRTLRNMEGSAMAQQMAYLLAATVVLATQHDPSSGRYWLPYRTEFWSGRDCPVTEYDGSDYLDFGGYPCADIVAALYPVMRPALEAVGRDDGDVYRKAQALIAWRESSDPPTRREDAHERTVRRW